eukprot:XP_020401758.1 CASP-like protein 4D1 [Zea mays]
MAKVSPRARALAVAITLVLRVVTLGLLAASLAVIATRDRTHYDPIYVLGTDLGLLPLYSDDGVYSGGPAYDVSFQDLYTFWYVLSVAAIGCACTLLALIFVAAIAVVQGRQGIGGTSVVRILVFIDVVLCALLTSGGAAGLGLVVDNQRINGKSFDSAHRKFYAAFDASCGLLLAAAVCTVIMVMLSVSSSK